MVPGPQPASRLDAAHPRHPHVHHDQVRQRVCGRLERCHAVRALTDHLEAVLGGQDPGQAGPDDRLVVDQQDADHADGTGSRATTRHPCGVGPACSSPPTVAARSPIPVSP